LLGKAPPVGDPFLDFFPLKNPNKPDLVLPTCGGVCRRKKRDQQKMKRRN